MKNILFGLAFVILFSVSFSASAQETAPQDLPMVPIEDGLPVPGFAPRVVDMEEKASLWPFSSLEGEDAEACFASFDTVQMSFRSELPETVPGSNLSFPGVIRNDNEFSLVNGTAYLRIFQKINENEYRIVDQIATEEKLSLLGSSEKEITFTWHVPENLSGGEYTFSTYFVAEGKHLLSGAYFNAVPAEESPSFRVVSEQARGIELVSSRSSLNDQLLPKTGYPLHFSQSEDVVAKVTLLSRSSEPSGVQVSWEEYAWDDFRKENLLNQVSEVVAVEAGATKEISYTIPPRTAAVSYLVVTVRDQYGKSTERIRLVRDGMSETRLGFPFIEGFFGKSEEAKKLSVCVLSTSSLEESVLRLNWKNDQGASLHTFQSEESLHSPLQIVKTDFTTGSLLNTFFSADIQRGNEKLDAIAVSFACLPGQDCSKAPSDESFSVGMIQEMGMKGLVIGGVILVSLFALILVFIRRVRLSRGMGVFLLFLFMGGMSSFSVPDASAAQLETLWVSTGVGKLTSATNNYCPNGWTWGKVNDDNNNGDRHLGEEDTDDGVAQLCLRSSDPNITISAEWGINSCPSGTSFSGAYDDAGSSNGDDKPYIHSTNEEDFRPDNSMDYRWCLGASGGGATGIQTRWVRWPLGYDSSRKNPPCAADETRLLAAHYFHDSNRYLNMNHEDHAGTNQLSLCGKIIVVNRSPVAPTLTGPTSGLTNTPYTFTAKGTDPDAADNIRYGFDWDNNGGVDEWTGYVASGTSVGLPHTWLAAGTYTIRALTQDSSGDTSNNTSGWSNPITITIQPVVNGVCGAANGIPTTNPPVPATLCFSGTPTAVTPGVAPGPYSWGCTGSGGGSSINTCSAPYLIPLPAMDLRINGSNGPLTVLRNSNLNITWGVVANATSCTGSGNGWSGAKSIAGGNDNVSATNTATYTLTCVGPGGTASDSVSVTLQNTLKVCENSCNSNIELPSNFSMARGASKVLAACWNTALSCTDASGNITTVANWGDQAGNNVIGLPASPQRVTADNPGNETFTAHYSGNISTKNVTVTCIDTSACQNASGYATTCQSDTFTTVDSCGVTRTCNGSKSCDFNWKEVAP